MLFHACAIYMFVENVWWNHQWHSLTEAQLTNCIQYEHGANHTAEHEFHFLEVTFNNWTACSVNMVENTQQTTKERANKEVELGIKLQRAFFVAYFLLFELLISHLPIFHKLCAYLAEAHSCPKGQIQKNSTYRLVEVRDLDSKILQDAYWLKKAIFKNG